MQSEATTLPLKFKFLNNSNFRRLAFDTAETLIGISLYGCRPAREQSRLPPPPPPIPPPPSSPLNMSVGLNGNLGSFISLQVSHDQVLER